MVFRATNTRLERQVALKMLPPEATARGDLKLRILREARAAAALNHPNVCAVYDVDGACFDLARACAVLDRSYSSLRSVVSTSVVISGLS